MNKQDPRIDAYIAKAAPFAQAILQHIRKLVHKACPDITETMKWSFPHFEYKGVVCSMAAFKQHCAFGFWKASIMKDPNKIMQIKDRGAMGHFDRITTVKDLPADKIMIAYIKEAVQLNEKGIKLPAKTKTTQKEIVVPSAIIAALKKNTKAKKVFEAFSPSHQKEYIEWITEAKTEPTRIKRLNTMLEWLEEGKDRNWKYK
ncbi:MAG: YdeI/OmpD-associated family protein [Chitinophagaceae bacterium]|nr:YdeI/OmpD-associated family protein [Chitinophagaceae bacterium]